MCQLSLKGSVLSLLISFAPLAFTDVSQANAQRPLIRGLTFVSDTEVVAQRGFEFVKRSENSFAVRIFGGGETGAEMVCSCLSGGEGEGEAVLPF